LYCCLAAAVRRQHSSATDREVQQRISKYLAESGDREGYRQQRCSLKRQLEEEDISDVE
jgi:hypothetical protein